MNCLKKITALFKCWCRAVCSADYGTSARVIRELE